MRSAPYPVAYFDALPHCSFQPADGIGSAIDSFFGVKKVGDDDKSVKRDFDVVEGLKVSCHWLTIIHMQTNMIKRAS